MTSSILDMQASQTHIVFTLNTVLLIAVLVMFELAQPSTKKAWRKPFIAAVTLLGVVAVLGLTQGR